jgi:hypothetical protein
LVGGGVWEDNVPLPRGGWEVTIQGYSRGQGSLVQSLIPKSTQLVQYWLVQEGMQLQMQLPVPEGPEQLCVLACTFHIWCYRVLRTRYRVGWMMLSVCVCVGGGDRGR